MKKLLLVAVTYCFMQVSHAQSDSTYFEVGMNAIRLVRLGMDNGEIDSEKWNPYMFTCNLGVKRLNLRFGVGYESMFRRELPSSANGQTTSDTTYIKSDVRLGLGWEIGMGKKWDVKLGADFIMARRASVFTTTFINDADVAIENKLEYTLRERGISPFIFLQYHINKRVSLGTEILWRFSGYTMTEIDNSNLNSTVLERRYEGTKRLLQAPTALFVNVRF